MKRILKYIKEEVTRLKEAEYDVPEEIMTTLKDKLQMDPIERFVESFKAVNSIPPSYRVFLHNEQSFDIVYESFSLMVNIDGRGYYIADLSERGEAVEKINRLLTVNQMIMNKPGDPDDLDASGAPPKPSKPSKPPSGGPPKPGAPGRTPTKPPTPPGGETPPGGGGAPPPPPGGGAPKPPAGDTDKEEPTV